MKFGIREMVFMVLLLAIPVCAWWLAFRPQNAINERMMVQIEAKQAKLRELNKATATIGDLKKEIDELEKAIGFFRSKLPDEKEIDKVLQEIWKLAERNRLKTKSIRALHQKTDGFVKAGGPHAEQPIQVKLEGDFIGFYAFLQALEAQPRITRIRHMKLEKLDKEPEGAMRAEFEMSVFFQGSAEGT